MLANIETTDRRSSHYSEDLRQRARKRRQSQTTLGIPRDPGLIGECLLPTHQTAKWSFCGAEAVEGSPLETARSPVFRVPGKAVHNKVSHQGHSPRKPLRWVREGAGSGLRLTASPGEACTLQELGRSCQSWEPGLEAEPFPPQRPSHQLYWKKSTSCQPAKKKY